MGVGVSVCCVGKRLAHSKRASLTVVHIPSKRASLTVVHIRGGVDHDVDGTAEIFIGGSIEVQGWHRNVRRNPTTASYHRILMNELHVTSGLPPFRLSPHL